MRRIFLAILCLLLLTTAVSAAGSVSDLQSNAILGTDGTCQVSVVLQVRVDAVDSSVQFPLPGTARDITLNGSRAKTSRADSMRWVDLSDVIKSPGNYTLTLHYSLPDLVTEEKNGLLLTLPLLSGFSYPIEQMDFTISLPGQIEEQPVFTSTYHQSLESVMEYAVIGSEISGSFLKGLKDYETLTMTLKVDAGMFPQSIAKRWSMSYDDLLQYGLLLLALIYWLLFLRCGFVRRTRHLQAPDGMTAGELGCCISGVGVDLPTLILSWAQMGYLTIELDRKRRVRLHKTMEMGNERSEFEMRCFHSLFGKRNVVDGASAHLAALSNKVRKVQPYAKHYLKKHSGNPLIFRGIMAVIGAVAGYSLAIAFAADTLWQVLLAILFIPFGAVSAWLIQDAVRGVHLRYRMGLLIGGGCILLWFLLGTWSKEWAVAVFVVFSQILAGFAAVHGGRRTESGMQAREEALGLRRYLRTVSPAELARIQEESPEYFFTMAPYAIAMGVDHIFPRLFGKRRLSACPYLEVSGQQNMTARQWNDLLRHVVKTMDDRRRKLLLEKLLRRR